MYKIFLNLLKNILVFLVCGVLGAISTLFFAKPLLENLVKKDVGLGIIVLGPVLIIIYSIIFGLGSGITGIIIYNVIKFFRRKKNKIKQIN